MGSDYQTQQIIELRKQVRVLTDALEETQRQLRLSRAVTDALRDEAAKGKEASKDD